MIHEILHRHVTINEQKMLAVRGIAEDFKIQNYLVDATKLKEPSLPIDVIRKNMVKYLDEIETDRLFNRGMNDLPNKI